MYEGVAAIRFQGDRAKALELLPQAKTLLGRLQGVVERMGVDTYALHQAIGSEAYIHVLRTGGQNYVFISASPQETLDIPLDEPSDVDEGEGEVRPTFLSGLVNTLGRLVDVPAGAKTVLALDSFEPTLACATRTKLPRAFTKVPRLAIKPHEDFPEFINPNPPPVWSQYSFIKPSMYSGTMTKVVQVAMGYGTLSYRALPRITSEQKRYARAVKANGFQIRYDFRFHRTHGIYKTASGPWLVEISMTRGVLARPLPMFPRTVGSAEFAAGDSDMAFAIDEIGGLPTGMTFPDDDHLEAAITNGSVLRLAAASDLDEFYGPCSAYSTGLGWAFNSGGTEAHTTAYYYDANEIQHGVHYAVVIDITPRTNTVPAHGTATLRKQHESPQWVHNVADIAIPPFKVFEPLLNKLITHDLRPGFAGRFKPTYSDSRVHVFFLDDELYHANYYYDPDGVTPKDVTEVNQPDPDECPVPGEWSTEIYRNRSMPWGFYTTSHDDLDLTYEGLDASYEKYRAGGWSQGFINDVLEAIDWAAISRVRMYMKTVRNVLGGSKAISTAIAIPAYGREAVYYVHGKWLRSSSESTATGPGFIRDPNWGIADRNLFNSPGGFLGDPFGAAIRGFDPRACGTKHRQRQIVSLQKDDPYVCSEYADAGTWLNMCQTVDGFPHDTWPTPTHSSVDNASVCTVDAFLIANWGEGEVPISPSCDSVMGGLWRQPPTEGEEQFIGATWNCLGSPGMRYMKSINDSALNTGSFPFDEPLGAGCTFVGVVGG